MNTRTSILTAGIMLACASTIAQAATNWVKADRSHVIAIPPADAISSGHDARQNPLYVCRGSVGSPGVYPGWSPIPTDGCHIGSFETGQEMIASDPEFLVMSWESALGGAIPPNAVPGGFAGSGRPGFPPPPLYHCRAKLGSAWLLGKVGAGSKWCEAPYLGTGAIDMRAGELLSFGSYEVLVMATPAMPLSSVRGSMSDALPDAIPGGHEDGTGNKLYLCSASYNGMQPGALQKGKGCVISSNGQVITVPSFNVLVASWEPNSQFSTQPPKFEFQAGTDRHGDPLYVCRGPDGAGGIRPGLIGKYLAPCQIGIGGLVRYPGVLDLLTGSGQPSWTSGLP